ncbi:MAG: hypothetical protein ACI8TP_002942 [Acidimicrobiales bacterium]|jgi:hypothetical protein
MPESEAAANARNNYSTGWIAIDLSVQVGTNETRLRTIAQNMRVLRSLGPDAPLTVRVDELSVIGNVLDLEDPLIVPDVMRAFALDKSSTLQLLTRLHEATVRTTAGSSTDQPVQ